MNYNVKKIADYYGREHQILKLAEECGELIQAIMKYQLTPIVDLVYVDKEPLYSLIDELADVEIMLEQVRYLFDIGLYVNEHKNLKIHRQIERIRENERL